MVVETLVRNQKEKIMKKKESVQLGQTSAPALINAKMMRRVKNFRNV